MKIVETKNINKIAIYYKQKVLDTTSLPISIAHFWDVFHTQYKSIPDIFPQKLIFTSIFHLNPGKAYITEKQLEMRAKVFAIFLSSNLDEEWEHLSKSHNIIL